ncbi:MAG TPA: hypothetical protein VN653_15120 [Anaerolineales bacterium]|nr:hypothetical protein [Anaerolineales bacterium]
MNQNTKYFGMTIKQLGILAGLAGLAFLLFCIVGWMALAKLRSRAQAPAAIPTIQPMPTLITIPTLTATPAPTPLPYELLVPAGWVQYRTALYEIWMPTGYKTTNTTDVLMTGLGGTPIVDLSLRGATSSKSANKIYMTVSYEPMTAATFDAFLTARLSGLGLAPNERSKVTLNTVPVVRLLFSGRKGNTDINELTYVILDGTTVWYVQYTAEITDFYNSLGNFESSAQTFRVVK